LADQGLTVVVPLRQEVLDGSLACASCAAPKESLFEAVVDAVMREVHAKLVGEVASLADPMQALERGIRVFLKVCSDPKLQRILLIDAPAVPGWPKWREIDARCGICLLRQALGAAMKAGMLRHQIVDMLAHVLLGALTEAAMVIARSPTAAKSRKAAERALASVIAGWWLSD